MADASFVPDIPRANTHLTILAVAERLAERVQDRGVAARVPTDPLHRERRADELIAATRSRSWSGSRSTSR